MNVKTILQRAAVAFPDREAVIHGNRRLTFAQAWDRGVRLANVFRSAGLAAGDRVAVLENNTLEAADFFLACAIGNFVHMPLYVRNSIESHAHMAGNTRARALVMASNHAREGRQIVERLACIEIVIVRDDTYEDLLASSDLNDIEIHIDESDYYAIRHTGGTTSLAKPTPYTHRKWIANIRDLFYNWPTVNLGDAFLHQSPISHASGYYFMPTWMNGGRNVMIERPVPSEVIDLIEREHITHLPGISTILSAVVGDPGINSRDVSSVKGIFISGAPIAETTVRLAHGVFGDALFTGFGQTEASPVTFMGAREWFDPAAPARILSAGRAQPFAELAILDPETREELPAGSVGEIAARVDSQMPCIWEDPSAPADRMLNGWVLTGDIARLDDFGYLYIMDRKSDMIVSGGFNIYPADLENVIQSMPEVIEVAAFGIPDEKWSETPAAVCYVEDLESVSEQQIKDVCAERLGSYKKPTTVVLQDTPQPKSVAGKILRRTLREPYWAGMSRRVSGS